MPTIQISARIPAELKDRIDALKQPGEPLGAVLGRAIAALEAVDASTTETADLLGLVARIEALEAWRASKVVASASKTLPDDVAAMVADLRASGSTWEEAATVLNEKGYLTARDKPWTGDALSSYCRRHGVGASS